ncbi:MAG: hypothetical protein IPN70_02210 [Candidatus Moraniibacteriota bacterium]|nr:MAG: hypothetical protein IPN70_02210 [Candidatus Moranbacteria bacterium]
MINTIKKAFYVLSLCVLTVPAAVSAQLDMAQYKTDSELSTSTIWETIQRLMQWLLYILGFVAVIAFVISGLIYLTSGGNEDRASTAKNAMVYAIIGVVVALLGLIILNAANAWLLNSNEF